MSLSMLALQMALQWTWVWVVGRPGFPPALALAEGLAQLAVITACLASMLFFPGSGGGASDW